METAMDQETMEAQERLLKKRERLGVTNNLTPLTPNIELVSCYHEEKLVDPCQHGNRGRCWDCEEEASARRLETNRKNELRHALCEITSYLKQASIPAKYINSSFDTFAGNEKLTTELSKYENESVVMYGNTGCGKTHLAVAIIRSAFINNINHLLNIDWGGKDHNIKRILFKPVPDLLLEIRQSFRDNSQESEEQIINKYCRVDLLVLDDLGSEKTSEYSITTLYIIIDRRDRDLKPTIITTNLSQKEIEEKLGARIASRIAGMKNIKINMPDYRKKRG